MGSPSFAKPDFVSAIAVMVENDFSEQRINEMRMANDMPCDEDDDEYVSDYCIVEMLAEVDAEYASYRADEVKEILADIKELVDSKLESLKPQVDFGYQPWVSEWFEIEQIEAYNGDGIGFELAFGHYTPYPYAKTDTLASVFWEEADQEQAKKDNVTYEQVEQFFEVLTCAYDYMMLAVGYNEYIDVINGGWCSNTSAITEAPTPDDCLKGTGIIEIIKESLRRVA